MLKILYVRSATHDGDITESNYEDLCWIKFDHEYCGFQAKPWGRLSEP